jgi:hypothetical protein
MAMGTRNPIDFYPIRVRVWVNFHTHGFVNGHNTRRVHEYGFVLIVPKPVNPWIF